MPSHARSLSAPRVAIATCAAYPELDPDDRPLIAALQTAGLAPSIAVWNDPHVLWQEFDLVVLRSTWDYTGALPQFLAWIDGLAGITDVANSADVVRWSSEKTYLQVLAAAGVPTVPTIFVHDGEDPDFPDCEFVVKPTVSAGSRNTYRFSADRRDAAHAAVRDIHLQGKTVMIQPYLASVDTQAETAMVYLDGTFSHAARKAALLGLDVTEHAFENGLFIREEITARTPRADQRAVADAALACAPHGWLYARVDLIDDHDGRPVVLEVEMVEPSLFLGTSPDPATGAAARLAQAICSRLGD